MAIFFCFIEGMMGTEGGIEFAGIHTDPSLRCGGNRNPELAARSDDRAAQTTGFRAAGAAALIPSFAREESGSSSRSFKAIYPGLPHPRRLVPAAECAPQFLNSNKNQVCYLKKSPWEMIFSGSGFCVLWRG